MFKISVIYFPEKSDVTSYLINHFVSLTCWIHVIPTSMSIRCHLSNSIIIPVN